MLLCLANNGAGNSLEELKRQLLNENPQLRPMLSMQNSGTVGHPGVPGARPLLFSDTVWHSGVQGGLIDVIPHDAKRRAIT